MKSILVVDNQGGTLYCNVNTVKKVRLQDLFQRRKIFGNKLVHLVYWPEIGGLGEMFRQQSGDCSVMSGRGMIIWVISL